MTPEPAATHPRQSVLFLASGWPSEITLLCSTFATSPDRPSARYLSYGVGEHPELEAEWTKAGLLAQPFPSLPLSGDRLTTIVRQLNDETWDKAIKPPSRISSQTLRRPNPSLKRAGIRATASVLASLRAERATDALLARSTKRDESTRRALGFVEEVSPSLVVAMNAFIGPEKWIVAAAQRLGIPTATSLLSWDNPSTKSRMGVEYDAYIVWSEKMAGDLRAFYPNTANSPTAIIGAAKFDPYYDSTYRQSRETWCADNGLDPSKPVVVWALGSPNFLNELPGAVHFAGEMNKGKLGDIQLVVRPHPIHETGELDTVFAEMPSVVVQSPHRRPYSYRPQLTEQVNTFRHADVIVNLASTVVVDASVTDTPVVSLDYDPAPNGSADQLIKDINRIWTHFSPVARTGGVRLTRSPTETAEAVKSYLARPEDDAEGRRAIVDLVVGSRDGQAGHRLARAVSDLRDRLGNSRDARSKTDRSVVRL